MIDTFVGGTVAGLHGPLQRQFRRWDAAAMAQCSDDPVSAIPASRCLDKLVDRRRRDAPENHKVRGHKRHGEGAELTPELTGTNVRRTMTRDHDHRSRRTLDALGAAGDGGCNHHGWGDDRRHECSEFDENNKYPLFESL